MRGLGGLNHSLHLTFGFCLLPSFSSLTIIVCHFLLFFSCFFFPGARENSLLLRSSTFHHFFSPFHVKKVEPTKGSRAHCEVFDMFLCHGNAMLKKQNCFWKSSFLNRSTISGCFESLLRSNMIYFSRILIHG